MMPSAASRTTGGRTRTATCWPGGITTTTDWATKVPEDLASATQSELYGYDAVYRLDSFKRGQLNQQKTDVNTPTRTQTWTLDPLGNWGQTVVDSVTETRTHNSANELTARTIGQGPQISLTYDDAGNVTQDGNAEGHHQYVWDYRNRLIEAKEKQSGTWTVIANYKYDARTRRVLKVVTNKGALNGTTRFVWGGGAAWQCLEERARRRPGRPLHLLPRLH